jgi:pimeloyl-ACP methyl ester carboxylesterase
MSVGAAFVERGLRVIAMSRFGYLRTPLPADASVTAQADAHACLLDALKLERVAVVGGSAGAPSALQFALRHPQRTTALALVVPVAYLPRPGNEPPVRPSRALLLLFDTALRWDFLYWAAIRLAPDTVMRAVMATPPEQVAAASAGEQARLYGALEQGLPVSARRAGLLNDGAILTTLPRYPLERITAPTLVISTANDLFGTYAIAQYTANQIPRARFVGFPDGGHLWVGHHEALVTEITALVTAAPHQRTR